MNTITHDELQHLITDALERTAFVIVDPCDGIDLRDLPRHAKIVYTGGESGTVRVSATDGFLAELASSLLGVEPDEVNVEQEGLDALRELANIVGGSILNELGGAAETFRLGLPELADAADGASDAVTCAVESDEGTLVVSWKRAA